MNFTKKGWRYGFLAAAAIPIIMELYAVFDGNPDTETYTKLITAYVPSNITYLILGGLFAWALTHFIKYYGSK